jgi:single-stranded-DNA-specific exonuclease
LAKFGLKKINDNPSPGLEAMKDVAGPKKEYTISDVVFKIAPRINSAGRMASGKQAVEILVSNDYVSAKEKVIELNKHNDDRRDTDKEITLQAFDKIKNDDGFESRMTTVLYDGSWHKGVIGIVASRMIERYYRPTIIFTGKDGVLSGSARSVKNFNLYEALEQCSDLLIQFGGHKYAAGMTLQEDNFEKFRHRFDEVVSELIEESHLKPVVDIDSKLNLSDITPAFFQILKQFAPFGPGNMNPVFRSDSVVIKDFRVLTDKNDNEHLKFKVIGQEIHSETFDVIGFGMGNRAEELDNGVVIDLVYNIDENTWNGRTTLQLVAKDLKVN